MPLEIMELMKLYPQPVQRSGVEFLPIDVPHQATCRLKAPHCSGNASSPPAADIWVGALASG